MATTIGCGQCARRIENNRRFCPFCGASQASRLALLDLLQNSERPRKARELTRSLSRLLNSGVTKSEVNRILYSLMDDGWVCRDTDFAWSFARVDHNQGAVGASAVEGPENTPTPPGRAGVPFALPAQIGHWRFSLTKEPNTGKQAWIFECSICGMELTRAVRSDYAVWLWPKIPTQREAHDREHHAERLTVQASAERAWFGLVDTQPALTTNWPGPTTESAARPARVYDLIKASIGRRLMRGFSLIRGNR